MNKFLALFCLFVSHTVFAQVLGPNVYTFTLTEFTKGPNVTNPGGFPIGYKVNGVEMPKIIFYEKFKYTFDTTGMSCAHPIYFSTDQAGATGPNNEGFERITKNINAFKGQTPLNAKADYTKWCDGAQVEWTPDDTQLSVKLRGKDYYYQCLYHTKMGWQIEVRPETPCELLERALSINQTYIVTNIVDNLFDILFRNNNLLTYFDGTLNSVNYTSSANAVQFNALKLKFAQFFAQPDILGCNGATVGAYNGLDMTTAHKNLIISKFEFDEFMSNFKGALVRSNIFGSQATLTENRVKSFKRGICNEPNSCRTSICDVYSDIKQEKNIDFITRVIATTLDIITQNDDLIKPFFAGKYNTFNYTGNPTANETKEYIRSIGIYMGINVLNCSDIDFPQYTGRDLPTIHKDMPIGLLEFDQFNKIMLQALDQEGVSVPDQDAVYDALNNVVGVCNQKDCGKKVEAIYSFRTITKTAQHPYFGQGFAEGYVVDEYEGNSLNLTVGKTYIFKNNSPCNHPIFVSTSMKGIDSFGAPLGRVTDGVVAGPLEFVCDGESLTFTPSMSQYNGPTLYYQCLYHSQMGYKINICDANGQNCGQQPSTAAPTTPVPTTVAPTTNVQPTTTPVPTTVEFSSGNIASVSFFLVVCLLIASMM